MSGESDIPRRTFVVWLLAVLVAAAVVRVVFLTADPPWRAPVGITWHDEGPWVHNARNKVLFGRWSLDQWNPMYLSPVFTGLEYASFSAFGVGTWQARLVSVVMGVASVGLLALGTAAVSGRRAGLFAALLLASNFIYVMWNRAALMEGTMTAFIVASWAAYALAPRRPALGLLAAAAAVLAFFTKAAAAFFVAALVVEATIAIGAWWWQTKRQTATPEARAQARVAAWTLAGLAAGGIVALVVFVVPFWNDFRFYNWQMSVVRKPAYTLQAFVDRASWVPIVHDFFTRQYLVTVLALVWCLGLLTRVRQARPAERLLHLWVGLGLAELVFHDVGNERRFIFFIPAFVAMAALVLAERRLLPAAVAVVSRRARLLTVPLVLYAIYIAVGALTRLPFLYQVRPGVRSGAVVAVVAATLLYLRWPAIVGWLSQGPWPYRASALIVGLVVCGDLGQFGQWASERTYKNIAASRAIGEWLPPGTLVHGKLANGLALENRIRPVFVGRGFGNYADRLTRPDIRYVLSYTKPRLGYEGSVILDVLERHAGSTIVRTFPVAETSWGRDEAALILKP